MGLCLTARAESDIFTSTTKYKIKFELTVSSRALSGAAYVLTSSVVEIPNEPLYINPYYYPHLYVKAHLYGTGSTNSIVDKTFDNAYKGEVSASRSSADCEGEGFGYFRAYGNDDYGEVKGTVKVRR